MYFASVDQDPDQLGVGMGVTVTQGPNDELCRRPAGDRSHLTLRELPKCSYSVGRLPRLGRKKEERGLGVEPKTSFQQCRRE